LYAKGMDGFRRFRKYNTFGLASAE